MPTPFSPPYEERPVEGEASPSPAVGRAMDFPQLMPPYPWRPRRRRRRLDLTVHVEDVWWATGGGEGDVPEALLSQQDVVEAER